MRRAGLSIVPRDQGGVDERRGEIRVALVDPTEERRRRVAQIAGGSGASVMSLRQPREALALVGSSPLDCALLAADPLVMDGDDFSPLLQALRRAEVPVLCYAAAATRWPLHRRCRLLLWGTHLLFDSASPSFSTELGGQLRARLDEIVAGRENDRAVLEVMAGLGIAGTSPPMARLLRTVMRLAPLTDLPVLILGETGTGKELVARALHALDERRRTGPFIALNCAALPAGLAEAELFGHRRGAFSGAERSRAGLFRAANGGVLFLDEIGELRLDLQAKLLRVLQEGRVLSVGDDEETRVDVRVIAATNGDLAEMVQAQRFRQDLWQRLSVIPLRVPPLRERRQDVPALVARFVARHGALRPGGPLEVTGEFVEALARARLPGNVRQLENTVRRALAEADHHRPLDLADLPPELWEELADQEDCEPAPTERDLNLARSLDSCERSTVVAALVRARGSQVRAAHLLGITGRSVYNKLRKHGLADHRQR
jgi:transcriptional regulator with GAF, ATPase, and Fis domain/CheY-like chemotaxis protein